MTSNTFTIAFNSLPPFDMLMDYAKQLPYTVYVLTCLN